MAALAASTTRPGAGPSCSTAPCCRLRVAPRQLQRPAAPRHAAAAAASDGAGPQQPIEPEVLQPDPVADLQHRMRQQARQEAEQQEEILMEAQIQEEEPPLDLDSELFQSQQLWAAVEACVGEAEALEADGRADDAVRLLMGELEQLQATHGDDTALTVLRQVLWDFLYAAGRHSEAFRHAAAVREAVVAQLGQDSAEAHMVAVRLGMSIAGAAPG